MWLYGSGFPKSNDLSKSIEAKLTTGSANTREFKHLNGKQINRGNYGYAKIQYEQGARKKDYNTEAESTTYLGELEPTTELAKKWKGWGSCLKPAYEPIIIARKPFKGSLVDNVIQYGVGGINIDECRVGNEYFNQKERIFNTYGIYDTQVTPAKEYYGRFPANVITDGSDEVAKGMPNTISRFDENNRQETEIHRRNNDILTYGYKQRVAGGFNDSGSAMRYFYCAKASPKDRDEGCDNLEDKPFKSVLNSSNEKGDRLDGAETPIRKNTHTTVKPVELMQYLVRMVAPRGATILDCFMGSGSTGKAVMFENRERNANYKFIGVEMTEEYLPIANARIDYAKNKYEYDEKKAKQEDKAKGLQSIFDFID